MRFPLACTALLTAVLAGCGPVSDRLNGRGAEPALYAPGIDPRGEAVDGLEVGHRLMAAGQHQLALDAFLRAAADEGLTPEIQGALGSANLALGRLGQAERLLRVATLAEPDWPEAWNNLGVVLIETGRTAEAAGVFRRAYALDNGQSDAIRDNLRLALAKLENPGYTFPQQKEFRVVRLGLGAYAIRRTDKETEQ
jgi:Flp pilus assembly protein TadD